MAVDNTSLRNLYLDVQGSAVGVKPAGDPVDRVITIRNQGDRYAEIEVWIEPANAQAESLQHWASFDKTDAELGLDPQESIDVTLSFLAPLQAEPGFYSYEIRARSPQYPGEELRRAQQLEVLPAEQDALRLEPSISLDPATDSTHPYRLESGGQVTITVTVHNPSRRTDRFYLTCPDLPAEWVSITYPENQVDIPGQVAQTDGLQLNPLQSGTMQLQLHPPPHTPAGNYFPTLRLTSSNRPDLVLLEIIYLTIPVDDRLQLELVPTSRTFPAAETFFQVRLANSGNIERDIALSAYDADHTFAYPLNPDVFHLAPGATVEALLQPHPRHWWQRLWRLQERTIHFTLEPENLMPEIPASDAEEAPDLGPENLPAFIPTLPEQVPVGDIHWKAQRRWLFRLLMTLLSLGLFVMLLWMVWYFLFWRPSLRPRIAEFDTTQENYQEGTAAGVTLDWQITNPSKVGQLTLSVDGQESEQAFIFTNVPIPKQLEDVCELAEITQADSLLDTLLRLHRRLATDSPNTEVLQCRGVPPEEFSTQAGTYAFKLQVFRKAGNQIAERPADIQTLEDVVVAPPAPPQILTLEPTATEYSIITTDAIATEPDTTAAPVADTPANGAEGETSANGETTDTTTAPENGPADDAGVPLATRPQAPIRLNWQISNYEDIGELKLVSLAPDGSENVAPETFDFTEGLPFPLQGLCDVANNQLTCRDLPTGATEVGDYVFYLTVVPKDGPLEEDIVKSTATIPIKPPAPEIVSFTLNGRSVQEYPKQVFVVNPARGSLDVILNWEVNHASQVELLPAPGMVQGNSINYTLSAASGSEMVTLRAVNELEEEVTQSIVIEKVGYDPAQPPSPARANAEAGGVLPPPPTTTPLPVPYSPTRPSSLPPAEEPPRAN